MKTARWELGWGILRVGSGLRGTSVDSLQLWVMRHHLFKRNYKPLQKLECESAYLCHVAFFFPNITFTLQVATDLNDKPRVLLSREAFAVLCLLAICPVVRAIEV